MSTPAYKKAARQAQQRKEKEHRLFVEKYGLNKIAKKRKREFVAYMPEPVYRRETPNIPSLSGSIPVGFATKKPAQVYTGDLIVGIATMHKSNAVPVMRGTSQAEDIAKMRRG